MAQPLQHVLQRITADADRLGVSFTPPLPEPELQDLLQAIRAELGVEIPPDYVEFLRFSDGLDTQCGYLCDLKSIGERHVDRWHMDTKSGVNEQGQFEIRYIPRETPKQATYLHLGYQGNMAEFLYDFGTGEYRDVLLGHPDRPNNADRTLTGFLRYLVYREDGQKYE